jgi:hypothetical protein
MSVDSGLEMQIETSEANWSLFVLARLNEFGWRMDDNGNVVYLPLGDDGNYEWTAHTPDAGELTEIFRAKVRNKETLGVILTWHDTQVGGEVRMDSSGRLAFSASLNRRCIANSSTTDVSWYLSRFLPPLEGTSVKVVSWKWSEAL